MSVVCPKCSSTQVIKKGIQHEKQRYRCNDCRVNFGIPVSSIPEKVVEDFKPVEVKYNKWVVTSAVSDLPVNEKFFNTLLSYCDYNHAKLLVIPLKYKLNQEDEEFHWDPRLTPYIFDQKATLMKGLRIHANFTTTVTASNPLTGLEPFSRGNSVIVGHTSLMMKTIASNHVDYGAVLTTTGCVTHGSYTETKAGEKALINHSYSALVIEEDGDIADFHLRVLNADENGSFYDLDLFYHGNEVDFNSDIPGIIIGDEHISHIDEEVADATFFRDDSIVNTLRPKLICRHDSFDAHAGSHHHRNNVFTQYTKFVNGDNVVEDELHQTMEYIHLTTPSFSESVIISSNHNDHLSRWLQECNPKIEIWNSTFYHKMMYLMHKNIETEGGSTNPFKLWHEHEFPNRTDIKFADERDSFKIKGIELAYHGHHGINGSRGSATQFAKLDCKTISGHSHSPQIVNGAYVVGHSCKSKLDYNLGPSSWHHAHCLIQPNGRRQLVFIKKGKWRV